MDLSRLKSDDFAPFLNQIFRVQLAGVPPIELELILVADLKEMRPLTPEQRQPFRLHFRGPVSDHYLIQRLYLLEHEVMGQLEIFITPLGPEAGRMRYEAIFA
jgi:hypothetical protein